MICNPMLMPQQQSNPFDAWQKLWLQGFQSMQPQAAPQAPTDPFTAMQNAWLGMFMPQQGQTEAMSAPKITVTTIELGDMRPYMQMASQMMQAMQPMLQPMFNQMLGGGRR